MQTTDPYDVAIIGGGPAGSSAATVLAREGKRVIVLEKEAFPRFHIGESLLPYNVPIFEKLGVLEKIEEAGFVPKYGARFALADGSIETALRFSEGRFTCQPKSYQVERSRFDEILLRHSQESGAEVREGVRVLSHQVFPDRVELVVEGEDAPLQARVLIDATGQANLTGTREGIRQFSPKLKKVAIFGHFDNIDLPDGNERGDIIIFRLEGAWFWFIPISDDRVSLGLVIDQKEAQGNAPEDLFEQAIERSPALKQRLQGRQLVGRVRSMADFSYVNRRMVSPRLIRAGDAAGFIDPIFSSGVYLAMFSGCEAAEVALEAVGSGRAMTPGMRRYERRLRKAMRGFTEMIDGFYTRPFIELLLQPQPTFSLPSAVNAVLAGRIDQAWKIRWRMRAFHALVWIQNRIPIVPRVNLPALR